MNPPDDHNITVSGNWHDGNFSQICVHPYPASSGNLVANNTLVSPGSRWPAAAEAIISNAGPTARYPLPPVAS
jgi:hypothetical protein